MTIPSSHREQARRALLVTVRMAAKLCGTTAHLLLIGKRLCEGATQHLESK